jgi:hypothetical protein
MWAVVWDAFAVVGMIGTGVGGLFAAAFLVMALRL